MAAVPPIIPQIGDPPPASYNPANPVDGLLQIIGFEVAAERQALIAEVFPDLRTISLYAERDLKDIVREFRSRTIAAGRIAITRITMLHTLGLIRWVQDT
jgi:hypothetical protein